MQNDKHEKEMQALRNEFEREIQQLKNDGERDRTTFEQNRALINVVQTTVQQNTETNNRLSNSMDKWTEVERERMKQDAELREMLNLQSTQIGNAATAADKARLQSQQTLESVELAMVRISKGADLIEQSLNKLDKRLDGLSNELAGLQTTQLADTKQDELLTEFRAIHEAIQTLSGIAQDIYTIVQNTQYEAQHEDQINADTAVPIAADGDNAAKGPDSAADDSSDSD